jgi:hypothetical protein
MSNSRFESLAIALIVLGSCLATGVAAQTQAPASATTPAVPRVAATRAPTTPATSQAEIQAEREEIWNSPDMLRARAWLKDYCSKSAKVTPAMAKQYEAELANMSPNQMRIWLMKFDEQEQYRQQQYEVFQQQNTAGLQQAMAVHKQTQQAYSALNQAATASAQNAQQQINTQRAAAQSEQENKEIEQSNPYPYYGGGGYAPYGFGGAQYHYHFYGN